MEQRVQVMQSTVYYGNMWSVNRAAKFEGFCIYTDADRVCLYTCVTTWHVQNNIQVR